MIGQPSSYGRKNGPEEASQVTGSRLGGYAYEEVYQRIFVEDGAVNAWSPHGRILVFDVRPESMKHNMQAVAVLGQPDFSSFSVGGVGPKAFGSIGAPAMDETHQRLFTIDAKNNRVLVWDVHPSRLVQFPDAMAVIGQADFMGHAAGRGAAQLSSPSGIFYHTASDRLFVADGGNNRVLVFDVRPEVLRNGLTATHVLGQPDFEGREGGVGQARMNAPGALGYHEAANRLFVEDAGNERLLVFDVDPDRIASGADAVRVLGQADFTTVRERRSTRKWSAGLDIDQKNERLFAAENGGNRMLVFDIRADRLQNNPDAQNLLFRNGWEETDDQNLASLSQTQDVRTRPWLDDENQILYTAGGYEGRNAVAFWNVAPDQLKVTGQPAFDVLGQYDWFGNVDFTARAANGRGTPSHFYPRGVVLDPIDHRIFINDQYMQRVLVYDLDDENRILNRSASVVLGQPDAYNSEYRGPQANTMRVPLALEYDPVAKHLFVADGRFNRILVFDARPGVLKTFDNAIAVIGQSDFTSIGRGVSQDEINMGVADGAGITSTRPMPMGFAVDPKGRRLFFSDGTNNRVLIYHLSNVRTGMTPIGVIGQNDLDSSEARSDDTGFNVPNELAYDADTDRLFVVDGGNHRLLVFDAAPDKIGPGMKAGIVLGQPDFTSKNVAVRLDTTEVGEEVGRTRFRMPNGVAYDRVRKRLYVNDKGNDRVLVFEAAPEKLRTGMAALGVIGQENFTTRIGGYGEQEQLNDPRQIEFDPANQRLYVTDSFFGRLMVFDLPRAEREITLPARAHKTYSTLDAWNGRPEQQDKDVREAIRATAGTTMGAEAALTYYRTSVELDPASLRRSRVLISEASMIVPDVGKAHLIAFKEGAGEANQLVLSNPGSGAAAVRLRLRLADGRVAERRILLAPGVQSIQPLAELFQHTGRGTLQVTSGSELAAFMLRDTATSRGEALLLAVLPSVAPPTGATTQVVPGVKWGGGYRAELELVNPHDVPIQGTVAFLSRAGEPLALDDGSTEIAYNIAPRGVFTWINHSPDALAAQTYALIRSDGERAAAGAVTLRLWDKSLALTQRVIPAGPVSNDAWIPVDTNRSMLRQGDSEITVTVANPSEEPAELRFVLFDNSGLEKGRLFQILPPRMQRNWSLGHLFNVTRFDGSIRIWSDVAVAVSAERATTSVRGERVEGQVQVLQQAASERRGSLHIPGILNGAGLATQITLANPGETLVREKLEFLSSEGKPVEAMLR